MVEIVLWIALGLFLLVSGLAAITVFVAHVTQIAFIEHLEDWKEDDK